MQTTDLCWLRRSVHRFYNNKKILLSTTKGLCQATSGQLKPMNVVNMGHKLFSVYGRPSIASGSALLLV